MPAPDTIFAWTGPEWTAPGYINVAPDVGDPTSTETGHALIVRGTPTRDVDGMSVVSPTVSLTLPAGALGALVHDAGVLNGAGNAVWMAEDASAVVTLGTDAERTLATWTITAGAQEAVFSFPFDVVYAMGDKIEAPASVVVEAPPAPAEPAPVNEGEPLP